MDIYDEPVARFACEMGLFARGESGTWYCVNLSNSKILTPIPPEDSLSIDLERIYTEKRVKPVFRKQAP